MVTSRSLPQQMEQISPLTPGQWRRGLRVSQIWHFMTGRLGDSIVALGPTNTTAGVRVYLISGMANRSEGTQKAGIAAFGRVHSKRVCAAESIRSSTPGAWWKSISSSTGLPFRLRIQVSIFRLGIRWMILSPLARGDCPSEARLSSSCLARLVISRVSASITTTREVWALRDRARYASTAGGYRVRTQASPLPRPDDTGSRRMSCAV